MRTPHDSPSTVLPSLTRAERFVGRRLFFGLSVLTAIAGSACGARSDLQDVGGTGGENSGGGGAGTGSGGSGAGNSSGGGSGCADLGAACVDGEVLCCEGVCLGGTCVIPPPACAPGSAPVVLATGLADPYAMDGDETWLFVGQLETGKALVKIPKAGGPVETLVGQVEFADYLVVADDTVFYSRTDGVSLVPTAGGAAKEMTEAFGPAGLAVTKDKVFLAEYFGERLVVIDRATFERTTLQEGMSGIYRVAVAQGDVFFSTFFDGLYRYDLSTGAVSVIGEELGSSRAVLSVHDDVYFTVPKTRTIHRLEAGASAPSLVADLSSLGDFVESLVADGQYLYTAVPTGNGPGLVVRAPLGGGAAEVVVGEAGTSPSAVVVDEDCLYWTERTTGTVYRGPKAPMFTP